MKILGYTITPDDLDEDYRIKPEIRQKIYQAIQDKEDQQLAELPVDEQKLYWTIKDFDDDYSHKMMLSVVNDETLHDPHSRRIARAKMLKASPWRMTHASDMQENAKIVTDSIINAITHVANNPDAAKFALEHVGLIRNDWEEYLFDLYRGDPDSIRPQIK